MKKEFIRRSGILLLDKPAGMSSADAINKIKRQHPFQKIGHGGTLDPFATGLLVILIGEATKIARFLLDGEKEYEALAKIGQVTDTGDHMGLVIEEMPVPEISKEKWQELANTFLGKSTQVPPKFSALKVKGKALYEYARAGEDVEIKPREIQVNEIQILSNNADTVRFRVACGGGTYIRVLANDLAKKAQTLSYLLELRRTGSSNFKLADAITLPNALETASENLPILPLENALQHLPKVICNSEQAKKVQQGNLSVFHDIREKLKSPGYFLLIAENAGKSQLVAIANHNPMMIPFCSIERVFDPQALGT